MGIATSNQRKNPKLSQIWSMTPSNQYKRMLFKNGSNGLLAQKSRVTLDPKYDLNSELDIYRFRKNNMFSLVRAYDAQLVDEQEIQDHKNSNNICSQTHQIDVMTEMIPYRLSELPQLTFNQSIYVLKQSLKAYEAVYQHIGPINVKPSLIGINEQGQIKAWVNQNWAQNHPSSQLGKLQSTLAFAEPNRKKNLDYMLIDPIYRDQSQMVRNILDVVESKCQNGRFPKEFSDYFYIHSNSFAEARAFIDDYVQKTGIRIPIKIMPNKITIYSRNANQQIFSNEVIRQNTHYLPNYHRGNPIDKNLLVQSRTNATLQYFPQPQRQYKNVDYVYYKNYNVAPSKNYDNQNTTINYNQSNQRINYQIALQRSYSAPSNQKLGIHFNQTGHNFNVNTLGTATYSQLKNSKDNQYKNNVGFNIPKGSIDIKTAESQINKSKPVQYDYSPIQSYSPSKVQLVNNQSLMKNRSMSLSNIKMSQTEKY